MPEENDKNIRIPVAGEEGKHTGHKIRTIVISASEGIKALYCVTDKKNITYIFAKNKDWTMSKAKDWVEAHTKSLKSLNQIDVDQEDEFLKIIATYQDDTAVEWLPNSESFVLTEEIADVTMGIVNKSENNSEQEDNVEETMELIKIDKVKRLVYGVFLVPEKADHDGDVIGAEDIEKVAHSFISEYRTIDEMHKDVIRADIVESGIAWTDKMDYHGKKLKLGTWFGAIKVHDEEVWEKVQDGTYKGFSVRISGVREPIKKEG
ncbi:XkdF-like putative serine protease domain-containing protein [Candidatus Omnitrophota bacterium]